jgi:hypothetical protein
MRRYYVSARETVATGFAALLLGAVPLLVSAAVSPQPTDEPKVAGPAPGLDPSEVVRIQVEALRNNSLLDEGIEMTYRFASPGNKRVTGPLVRFTAMVHSAPYDRLLNHRSARYGPLVVSDDEAYQRVIIIDSAGEEIAYHWVLSRQSEGQYTDCWMTDGVLPVQRPSEPNGLTPA